MAMTKQLWSLSALAVEFGMDRRAVARRIDGIPPAGKLRKADAWHLEDVAALLVELPAADADGLTIEEAKRRRAVAEAQLAEMQVAREAGRLVEVAAVDEVMIATFSRVRARLLAVPSRVSPLLVGCTPAEAHEVVRKAIWAALQELSETTVEDVMRG